MALKNRSNNEVQAQQALQPAVVFSGRDMPPISDIMHEYSTDDYRVGVAYAHLNKGEDDSTELKGSSVSVCTSSDHSVGFITCQMMNPTVDAHIKNNPDRFTAEYLHNAQSAMSIVIANKLRIVMEQMYGYVVGHTLHFALSIDGLPDGLVNKIKYVNDSFTCDNVYPETIYDYMMNLGQSIRADGETSISNVILAEMEMVIATCLDTSNSRFLARLINVLSDQSMCDTNTHITHIVSNVIEFNAHLMAAILDTVRDSAVAIINTCNFASGVTYADAEIRYPEPSTIAF